MKKYCYIKENNVVGEPQELPINFGNISNFHILDDERLKQYGWLPYEKKSENKPIFVSSSYEILENKVIENYITRDKTQQEINDDLDVEMQNKWNEVRNKRNNLLIESDVYVVADRWEEMDAETKQKWSLYRKQLRDLPKTTENPDLIKFPTKPL